jgi:hypoxanthine phosphoribosyltransferase
MAKVLTVSCKHCLQPTRVSATGGLTDCLWCGKENDNSSSKVISSNRCERCGKEIGDDFCVRCVNQSSCTASRAVGKESVDFRKRAILIGPYISWQQFNQDILDFSDSLKGKGYDAVIGVPRSGMVVASQMSIRLGVPLYSLGEYGPIHLGGGLRVRSRDEMPDPSKALLVEDSTASGYSFKEACNWMGEAMENWNVHKAAIYSTGKQTESLDEYHRELELPHWFEWHLMWSSYLMEQWKVGVDFDGILCPDFTPEQDDDGWRYLDAMKKARCLVPAGTHIHAIITARLEKYRPWTQDWLEKHGVTYNHLVMGHWQTKEDRARACLGSYKAEQCDKFDVGMFVESCPHQSQIIKSKRPHPVLCPALGGSVAR